MNNRIEQPRDYVVRPCRKPDRARYERLADKARAAIVLAACAVLLWLSMQMVLSSAARADEAAAHYTGLACEMQTATTGFCPGDINE